MSCSRSQLLVSSTIAPAMRIKRTNRFSGRRTATVWHSMVAASCAFGLAIACTDPQGKTGAAGGWDPGSQSRIPTTVSLDSTELIVRDSLPLCPTCSIDTIPIVHFGSGRDPFLIERLPVAVTDSRGTIYAAPIDVTGQNVLVFNADGTQRGALGRQGDGPGEYRRVISIAVGPGDSIYVVHDGGRVSVFSPSGATVRSMQTTVYGMRDVAAYANGTMLIAGTSLSALGSGLPLHRLNSRGEQLRSFGSRAHQFPRDDHRLVALAPDGTAWAIEPRTFRLERTDTTGRIVQIIGAEIAQFGIPAMTDATVEAFLAVMRDAKSVGRVKDRTPEMVSRASKPKYSPIVPLITDLDVDSEGLIWTTIRLPADNWQDIPVEYAPGEEVRVSQSQLTSLQKTKVVVIDPVRFGVVMTANLPGYWRLGGFGRAIRMQSDASGIISGDVYRIRLRK